MASFLSIPFPGRYSKKIDIPDYKICLIDGGIIGEYYLEYENKMLTGNYINSTVKTKNISATIISLMVTCDWMPVLNSR